MFGIPDGHREDWYGFLKPQLRDAESQDFDFPAQYMFKEVPEDPQGDGLTFALEQMDRYGIDKAMLGHQTEGATAAALQKHPDRFFSSVSVDPNDGMDAVRTIESAVTRGGAKSVQLFPAGCN